MSATAFERLRAPLGPLEGGEEVGWLVGGALRDVLLGRPVEDVDVAVSGSSEVAARRLARAHGAGRFRLSSEYDSWRVHGGSLPLTVDLMPLQGATLDDDLRRRDFTINALALPVAGGGLIDRIGGRADLDARTLRMVRDDAFGSDPLRVVRLARQAHQLGFALDPATAAQAGRDAAHLGRVAGERVRDELIRLVTLGRPDRGVDLLDRVGALGAIMPELERAKGVEQNPYHQADVFGHTMEVVRRVGAIVDDPEPIFRRDAGRVAEQLRRPAADGLCFGEALTLAALMHDMAKPETRAVSANGRVTFIGHDARGAEAAQEWCRRYRMSRATRVFLSACVRHHLAPGFLVHRQPLSLRQIDRYLRRVDPIAVELAVLSAADRLATQGPRTRRSAIDRHLAVIRQVTGVHFAQLDAGPVELPINGAELARALDRPAGPWLQDLLSSLREEVLLGRIASADGAIAFAQTRRFDEREDPSTGGGSRARG